MNTPLSKRARAIAPSATLELAARAKALQAEGQPVLNLTAGEPDFPTDPVIVEAAHRALDDGGHFKYTPTPGVPRLRAKVAECYTDRLRIPVQPEMVEVANGAKQALYNALATATDPGDRVGILAPYWVTYVEQVRALGGEPVLIPCPAETGFRPDPDALAAELTRGLRLLLVNSPCNPTGAALDRSEWSDVLQLLEPHPTLLLSDEIYEDVVFAPGGHVSPLHVRPDLVPRICVVSGLSKAYSMTGWRCGYSIAPADWTRAMAALQGHVTSNINAVTQQAALTALDHPEIPVAMCQQFRIRRDLMMAGLEGIDGVSAMTPQGTFYLFLEVRDQLGDGDVTALAKRLLDDHLVAVVPGSAFADPHHLRLSFAASEATLREALDRLGQAFGARLRADAE